VEPKPKVQREQQQQQQQQQQCQKHHRQASNEGRLQQRVVLSVDLPVAKQRQVVVTNLLRNHLPSQAPQRLQIFPQWVEAQQATLNSRKVYKGR
jgi:hypothetical protein